MLVVMAPAAVLAGDLDSPESPYHPASAMPTLEDLYHRLVSGSGYTLRFDFVEPASGPGPTGHTLQQVMDAAPAANDAAGAEAAEVVAGAAYWGLLSSSWGPQTGTRPPAPPARTGQTTSYAERDDGDLERGVAWPNPRFTDNGNGTVTDHLTFFQMLWGHGFESGDTGGWSVTQP